MELPDLTNLNLIQLVSTFLFFTFIDTAYAWLFAAINHNFDWEYALDFLTSHVAVKGAPILFMGVIGTGVPGVVPAVPLAFAGAVAALAVYIGQVIVSVKGTTDDKAIVPG